MLSKYKQFFRKKKKKTREFVQSRWWSLLGVRVCGWIWLPVTCSLSNLWPTPWFTHTSWLIPTLFVLFFSDLNFFFYWSIVALQCHVSFCCIAKWISYMYTYIPSFLDFLPIQVTTEHWVEYPELYSRFSLVMYFIHSINSVHMSTPISQFITYPQFSPWYPCICSLCLCLYFCFVNKIIFINFFRFHIYALIYVFFFLFLT